MKIAFRADASDQIGSGHIMRCRALAHILRERGADIHFLCRRDPGNLIELLESEGHRVTALPSGQSSPTESADGDAAAIMNADGCDWLVVDHYALGTAWEERVRSFAPRILVIDDLANRKHACDALLDQNFSLNPAARYAGLTPAGTRLFLGPRYALLSESYASAPRRVAERPDIERVLLSFGGADLADMTGLAFSALSHPAFAHIAVDIVVGRSYPHRERLQAAAKSRAKTFVHEPRATLAGLLAEADIAIGAGGITTWERCRVGVPALVVTLAENQVPATRDLDSIGAIRYVGRADTLGVDDVREALRALAEDRTARSHMSAFGQRLVDGRGARRIAEMLSPSPTGRLFLRPAVPDDCTFYFDLATDPDSRKQSFTREPILWDGHCAWFERKLADANANLLVFEADGLPIGQLRFDHRPAEGKSVLSYALDPVARGRGWGKRLVALGIKRLMRGGPVHITAEVKPDNAPSRRVFEQLAFAVDPASDRLVYSLSPQTASAIDKHLTE